MRAADKEPFNAVTQWGCFSIVRSESMDGGRIRLAAPLQCAGQVVVKLLLPLFPQQFLYTCLQQAPNVVSPALNALLALGHDQRSSAANAMHRLGPNPTPEGSDLSAEQCMVVAKVLESSAPVHAIWSVAGSGKTRVLIHLLELWRRSTTAAESEGMVWVMVPRQMLREDIFGRVERTMAPGELMIWGSHAEWEDYLDDFVRECIDGQLLTERRELDTLDEAIAGAVASGDRQRVFALHARRYEWLRHHYLARQGDAVEAALARVRGVVLTVDLAIKILARLSPKHKGFLRRRILAGMLDEIHNVSRDQLLTVASHIPSLVCAGDMFQDLRGDRPGDCGSATDWLRANAVCHWQHQVYRYGPEVFDLLALDTSSADFVSMVRAATCAADNHTRISVFAFDPLEWSTLPDGSVWRCEALFTLVFGLVLDATGRGCCKVFVVTNYDRVRKAMQAFFRQGSRPLCRTSP